MDNGGYFSEHSEELSRKYPGKYVAIVNNKLVAVNQSEVEAFKKAKKKYPNKLVSLSYIPRRDELVTLL
ncbi:MAG: DUF5678 domain-containing protein [Candidatus Aenigmarchaeota archaeon]|nr:DUF5678 domain-containing protein [Candidatus Aenigmarchaeota archaeon]